MYRRLWASGLAVLVFAAGGCAPRAGMRPSSAATRAGASNLLPGVARVSCDGTDTQVLTPQVRPQHDGVHIEVDNRSAKQLLFDVRYPTGGGGGGGAPPGPHEAEAPMGGAWPVGPGLVQVRCLPEDADPGDKKGYVSLRIVDREGLWVSPELDCEGAVGAGVSDYAGGAAGEKGDPVHIAKRQLAGKLRPGDIVERAGYPNSSTRLVRVVRDGRTTMTVEYEPDGQGGWLSTTTTACSP